MGFGYESEILRATGFGPLVNASFNLLVENAVEKTQGIIETKLICEGYVSLQWIKVQNGGLAQSGHPVINGDAAVNHQHIRTAVSVTMSGRYRFVLPSMKENKRYSIGTVYNVGVHQTTGNSTYTFYSIRVCKCIIRIIDASEFHLCTRYDRVVLCLG